MDRIYRAIGATVVLVILGVSGCAQFQALDQPAPPELLTNPSSVADDTTSTLPEPFVYRIGVLAGLTTDNFWAFQGEVSTVWNAYILGPTKPSLYALNASDSTLRPDLATAHAEPEEDDDGTWSVTVALNREMAWSDSEPITAEDLVFTFETVRRLGLGGSWAESFPSQIEMIEAVTPTEVRITFADRPPIAVWPHAVGMAPIMPSHVWGEVVESLEDPDELYAADGGIDVGGGPLTLHTVDLTLVTSIANPGYPHGPTPDTVEYHVFEAGADALAALTEGRIDSIMSSRGLSHDHVETVGPEDRVALVESPANGIRYLGFNLNRDPMSNRAFRTALALLVERSAYSFITPDHVRWYDSDRARALARPETDLATRLSQAVAGLKDAGYTWETEPVVREGEVVSGTGLRIEETEPQVLTILTPGDAYDPARPLNAAGIAEVLGWLGFEARPVETDFDTVVDLAFSSDAEGLRQYDMYLLGWTLGNPSLPGFYRPLFAADGEMNNTGYSSNTFRDQLAVYESAYSIDEAREALWDMEATLATHLPYLVLFPSAITEAYRSDLVAFELEGVLGGLQGRLGGIGDVRPVRHR